MTFTHAGHPAKTEQVERHDRQVGWSIALVVTLAVIGAVVTLLRRLSRRVAQERADRVIEEAFAEIDR